MHSSAIFLLLAGAFARPGSKGRSPPLGWNTWCTGNKCGNDWCTSAEVLDVAKTIKELGMLELGYDHINLDDCWGTRNATTNKIQGDTTRFPEGMPAFIEKIHALGFKFGLYTDIGEKGCHHPFVGSWPRYQQDANTFAEWKVDYVKFDGCDKPSGKDAATLTCNMSQALNNTGREMWMNFHCWHDKRCAECGNSFRIDHDHHDDWANTFSIIKNLKQRQAFWGENPDYGWPDADFVFTGGQGCGGDAGPAGQRCPGQSDTEYITEFSIWAIATGEIVFASDPRNMSDIQRKVLFNKEILDVYNDTSGFHSIAVVGDGSIKLVTTDQSQSCSVSLTNKHSHASCTPGKTYGCLSDMKSMWIANGCRGEFTCNGVKGVNCDVTGGENTTCPCVTYTRDNMVFARPLKNGAAAVALFNGGEEEVDMTVYFEDIPDRKWSKTTQLFVRDLWQHTENGISTGSFTAKHIPSHGTVVVKLVAAVESIAV